jgi:hypothetical protein
MGQKKNILLLIGKLPIPRSEESIAQAFTDNRKSVILETLDTTITMFHHLGAA